MEATQKKSCSALTDIEWQILSLFSFIHRYGNSLINLNLIQNNISVDSPESDFQFIIKWVTGDCSPSLDNRVDLHFCLFQIRKTFFFIALTMYEMLDKHRNDTRQPLGHCYRQRNAPKAREPTALDVHMCGMSAFVLDTKWRGGAETRSEPGGSAPRWASYVFAFSRWRADLEGADR